MVFHAHNVNNGLGHPIPLGHVFVEFFFFLTGFFTYASLIKRRRDNTADLKNYPILYTLRKFRRFIPYIIMTATLYVVMSVLCSRLIRHISVNDLLREFSGLPFDVLLLQVTGICSNSSFNAWWYLSAILFTLPLAISLFHRKICSEGVNAYIVYCSPFLIYGAFRVEVNGLDWDREVFGIVKSGIFRSFAGLCMGCIIYDLKERLNASVKSEWQRMVLTIIEVVSYLSSVFIAWIWSDVCNSTFLIVLLLAIGMIITFSDKSYLAGMNSRMFSCLGRVSLPLYMCHYSIGRLIGRYFTEDNLFKRYLAYYTCSFLVAIGMHIVDRKLLKDDLG